MKLFKKIISIIVSVSMLFTLMTIIVLAENDINVVIDGNNIPFDVPPQIINDRTMVPLRAIFEALGASVDWNSDTRTVISKKGDTTISLTIDDTTMYVNDNAITLDSPGCIIDGRTLVPVRAISEAYGTEVRWDGGTRTVIINTELAENRNDEIKGQVPNKEYSHFGIKYQVPSDWDEPIAEGGNIYYYPLGGMLMLQHQNDVNGTLDEKAIQNILDSMSKSIENYQLLSINKRNLSNDTLEAYCAEFTGVISNQSVKAKMVVFQIDNSLDVLTYLNFNASSNDTQQFDAMVNTITIDATNTATVNTDSVSENKKSVNDEIPYYSDHPRVPDFGAITGLPDQGGYKYNTNNLNKSDFNKYLDILEDLGFKISVGDNIITCIKDNNLYVDIWFFKDDVIITITE